ncbi:MAG: PQQ-dependent sugar dehydrogenase [Candidatus Eisenbacteria bacterium]|nr:PQQ-dependent sugar dehydrogenase [Candidatus Eisenbacteria bacterium]
MLDKHLAVRTAVDGLVTPISMAFIDTDDMLVLEKNTGKVQRVTGGILSTVLDLAVNFGSERGLLGIALHPDFENNPAVFLFWTESTTGGDTDALDGTPLLGNRVDRYLWNGSNLVFDRNIAHLRALQPPNPPRETREGGNHNGGVLRFGPDDKLYLVIGDNGRRGQLQNLVNGPIGPGLGDDQFGGPEPDDAHLTGVVLRLNADGTTPVDNPFFAAGAAMGGPVGANVQKIFAYGIRNTFGLDFDPESGHLWAQIHGDDSFDELDRIERGANGGWIQLIGPSGRVAQFKAIETDSVTVDPVTNRTYFGLQQVRWSPLNIADTPGEALSRLFMLPGSHYDEPEFSWKYAVAPGGIGFLRGRGLGPQFAGDLFVAASRPFLEDGYLFRFKLNGNRRSIASEDPRLADRVADNDHKFDIKESESLLIGTGFGVGTDIQTGPNGHLYVVSLTHGTVYEIYSDKPGRGPKEKASNETDGSPQDDEGRGVIRLAADPSSFRDVTTIRFERTTPGPTTITIFDALGRQVRVLANDDLDAGRHELAWDGRDDAGRDLAGGIYFVHLKAEKDTLVRKLIIIR